MGIFGGSGGYQPTAKDRYHEQRAEQTWQRNQYAKEQSEARKILDSIPSLVEKEETKWKRAADDARKAVASTYEPLERAERTRPVTQYSGGSRAHPQPLIVWHWQCVMPEGCRVKISGESRRDAGPLLALGAGGGIGSEDIFAAALRGQLGSRKSYPEWAKAVSAALAETEKRYPILGRLRDDRFLADLLAHAGVARTDKKPRPEQGVYGLYQRPVTVVHVPVLIGVEVSPEGLVLTFAHESGVTAADWAKNLAGLRSEFGANGVHDASHLRVVEDPADASIRLLFEDVPIAFPRAVASTVVPFPKTEQAAIAAYPSLHWRFGVDARGNERSASVKDNPHVAIIAKTGWGKSILSASILENLRPYGSWMIFDGKGADHSIKLAEEPGVTWISKKPAEHLLGMKWLWEEMHERIEVANDAKSGGANAAAAFNFPPIFGLLDEIPSMRTRIAELLGADALAKFDRYVEDILQLGRQARIHLVLISQSLYVGSFPTDWQKNVSRIVFLGPVAARSMVSDEFPKEAAEAVERISSRIPDSAKGRAVYLAKSEDGVHPVPIQTYFDWAPGSTAMEMAPTDEVAAAWEAQRANLDGRPLLFDRIGLEVEDAEWAKLPLEELLDVPTVIVADEHGAIEGMEKYDLLSPAFVGKAAAAQLNPNRARGRGSGSAGKTIPKPESAAPKSEQGVPAADDDGLVL